VQIERDNTMALKGDNNILRRRGDLFAQEADALESQLIEREKEIYKLKKKLQDMEELAEGLKKEVDERNYTIDQKENRILEIKGNNQKLEKYRFVLDHKLNELRDELRMISFRPSSIQ
jgi:chromosome segregation ATPase